MICKLLLCWSTQKWPLQHKKPDLYSICCYLHAYMLSQFIVAALDPFTTPAVSAGLILQQHLAEPDRQMQWNDLHYGRCVCKTRDTRNSSWPSTTHWSWQIKWSTNMCFCQYTNCNEMRTRELTSEQIYGLTEHRNGTTGVGFRHATTQQHRPARELWKTKSVRRYDSNNTV